MSGSPFDISSSFYLRKSQSTAELLAARTTILQNCLRSYNDIAQLLALV
jgi:hypothetical protein